VRTGGAADGPAIEPGLVPVTGLLGPRDIVSVIRAFAAGLERHQATINRLNVFPVPDGDTGTNMLATVTAASRALDELEVSEPAPSMEQVCSTISRAALMGARGNSGVILCQILRGVASSWSPLTAVDAKALATALDGAAQAARAAVQRPAEGTILTVASAGGTGALSALEAGADLAGIAAAALEQARLALWSTPDQLPVLAEAGVVDAGGAGLLLLYDALSGEITGMAPLDELPLPESVRDALHAIGPAIEARAHASESDLRFEVMYLLEAPDEAIPAFRDVWATIGDSIVVVGGDGLWNCHIHTDEPGPAIEAALDVGRPREIRISDLSEQVEEERWVRNAAPVAPGAETGSHARTAVVAVASGEGIARIFRSLGVASVLTGGQSMNPSTAELLAAIEAIPADEVVVLPNNTNIYPVAHQAAGLANKSVVVVETPGIQEGFAALLEYDPDVSDADNARAMAASASRVRAGEVTQAVRASKTAAGAVVAGDWIALDRSGIVAVAHSPSEAACALLDVLAADDAEIVTLIEGVDATEAQSRAITEWIAEHRPGLQVERHRGGQPLYPYLISIE
jgi:uncharacterized protein